MLNLDKLATKNMALLQEMAAEEVLQLHPLIQLDQLNFYKVQKTRTIRARPISTLIGCDSVLAKMVLATLEGNQALKAGSFVCWGVDNDVWQQSEKNLHAKYTPTQVGADGWTTFTPKPDSPVNAMQITGDTFSLGAAGGFSVKNPGWGDERVIDGKKTYLQYGVDGDYILQGLTDPNDLYIVAKKFFDNTYERV
jgi:hypothetical protein